MTFIPPGQAAGALPRPSANAVRAQIPVTARSSTDGTATFTFPDSPQGQWQVGACTIAGAPIGAQAAALVGIQPWGVWNGPAPSPVIQVDPRTHLSVTVQFLAPNTTYTAWFIGWSDEIDALVFPYAASSSLPAFSSTSLQPQTTTNTIAAQVFGPFSVGAMAGMRFSAIAENLFSNALVDLRWYDSEAIANAPGLFDAAGVFDFEVQAGAGSPAAFVIPHLADWLVVTITSADAGHTQLHWSMAARQAGFDLFGQGNATGAQNVDSGIGGFTTVAIPPVNGPWYRLRNVTARANGTPTAGSLPNFCLSDDGVSSKAWVAMSRAAGVASEVVIDKAVDVLIANPTRLCFVNNTGVDMRVGATWEVVPPMFQFPRDS